MKNVLMLWLMALILAASPAFAGTTEDAYFFNQTDEARRVEIEIVGESGAGAMPSVTVPANGDAYYSYAGHYSEKQTWTFKVYTPASKLIAEAIVNWADGQFSPQVIGSGLTFETFSPDELKLTIGK